jgi:hypothetical protein
MTVLGALRFVYKQELGEDGYIDGALARKIMDAIVAYTDEADEFSTPPEDLRQWASILIAAADKLEQPQQPEEFLAWTEAEIAAYRRDNPKIVDSGEYLPEADGTQYLGADRE